MQESDVKCGVGIGWRSWSCVRAGARANEPFRKVGEEEEKEEEDEEKEEERLYRTSADVEEEKVGCWWWQHFCTLPAQTAADGFEIRLKL